MASKFDVFKYVYDNTDDKDSVINEFPEDIREEMRKSLDAGDEGLFVQLLTPTALSENGPVATEDTATASASLENVSVPDGDITEVARGNLLAVQEMNDDVHKATLEEVQALPEEIQEGVEIWRDASEDMSKLIILGINNALKGFDFSEDQILCTGATIAKDLQDSGYGKSSLNRATDSLESQIRETALEKLCAVIEEMNSLKSSAEDLVDYISEKDNLGLTPTQREQLVQIILDNGIFTDDSNNHDIRKDILDVVNTSGDYSIGNPIRKLEILNDFVGYEFSMEDFSDFTNDILSITGDFNEARNAVEEATNYISTDCSKGFLDMDDLVKQNAKLSTKLKKAKSRNNLFSTALKLHVMNRAVKKLDKLASKYYLEPTMKKAEYERDIKVAEQTPPAPLVSYATPKPLAMDSSEEVDSVDKTILMEDEALTALVAKYQMLPTLEAKNAMVQDALEHGIPQEYINAMIQRSKGEFSEDEGTESAESTESTPTEQDEMNAQQVLDAIESLGSDEIAQEGEVANPVDSLDGTLPAGVIYGDGGTQVEMIQDAPEAPCEDSDCFVNDPEVVVDDAEQFEQIV